MNHQLCPSGNPGNQARDGALSHLVPRPGDEVGTVRMSWYADQMLDCWERSVERQRQFIANASHELRTPVAGLRVTLEGALRHQDDTEAVAALTAALRETERVEAIVADLLLLARLNTDALADQRPVDLAELVEARVAGREDDIRTDLVPGVVGTGSPTDLARLLDNLLDNAQRHAAGVIEVKIRKRSHHVWLMVADDGPGIPPAEREQVFAPFARLDTARSRDAGGTGLGLAIADGIARAHGGTLCLANSRRGNRFVLKLPISPRTSTEKIS